MKVLDIKLEGNREDIQWIQFLVPLRDMFINRNVCGLHRSLGVGYLDIEFSLDSWDIMSSNN
jgi:hypothetical protein